jgi:hypothetical protein
MVQVPLEIRDEEVALSLAQFCKRVTDSAIRSCAADEIEARRMMSALHDLRQSLSKAGFAPR